MRKNIKQERVARKLHFAHESKLITYKLIYLLLIYIYI